jgi:hypothetical protein
MPRRARFGSDGCCFGGDENNSMEQGLYFGGLSYALAKRAEAGCTGQKGPNSMFCKFVAILFRSPTIVFFRTPATTSTDDVKATFIEDKQASEQAKTRKAHALLCATILPLAIRREQQIWKHAYFLLLFFRCCQATDAQDDEWTQQETKRLFRRPRVELCLCVPVFPFLPQSYHYFRIPRLYFCAALRSRSIPRFTTAASG